MSLVHRNELVAETTRSVAGLWFIEAGAGFGKTTLIEQVRSASVEPLLVVRAPLSTSDVSPIHAMADAAYRSRRSALAEALLGGDLSPGRAAAVLEDHHCSIAFDDVDRWPAGTANFVLSLTDELAHSSTVRVVLLARRCPPTLLPLPERAGTAVTTAEDLAFSVGEVINLLDQQDLDGAGMGPTLAEVTGGWPLAVGSVVSRMTGHRDPAEILRALGQHHNVVDGLVQRYTKDLSDEDRSAAAVLVQLPFFDDQIADMVGPAGLLGRLAASGVPITRQADGWSVIPGQIAASLGTAGSSDFHQSVVDHLVEHNEILAAVGACRAMGNNRAAAQVIAGLDLAQETRVDPSALNALMVTIGNAADESPRALLVQAQINISYGRFDEATAAIDRAVKVLADADPHLHDPVHVEVLLETGLWRVYEGREDEARELLDRCAEVIGKDDGPLRGRMLDLKGMIAQLDPAKEALESAREALVQALEIWRREREPRAAAATSFRLASTVLFRLGRRQEALDVLDNLPLVGQMTLINRARLGLERAISLPYLGRADEVPDVLAETRRIGSLLGHDWLLAWAIWAETVSASFEGSADHIAELTAQYQERGHVLPSPVTEAGMWAEVAQAHARCGNETLAQESLVRATGVEGMPGAFVEYAQAYVAAHFADPTSALALIAQLESAAVPVDVERQWTMPVLAALCHHRLGQVDQAHALLQEGQRQAAALGQPSLPSIVERAILERISAAPVEAVIDLTEAAAEPLTEIAVFETFGVTVNARPVEVPSGNVATLIKILVLGGGRLVVDQVIDPLWPEASLMVGRRRLRNVMQRLRSSVGDLVIREGDELVLAPKVSSDFQRAVAAADRATSADRAPDAVQEAIRLNNRPLLPANRYDDWAEEARSRHLERLVRLHDIQAELAEEAGNVELAVSSLEAAAVADLPDMAGTRRIQHACALLRSVDREAAAVALADRHGAL